MRATAPGAEISLELGSTPCVRTNADLDISRIRGECGFEPAYSLAGAIDDYFG